VSLIYLRRFSSYISPFSVKTELLIDRNIETLVFLGLYKVGLAPPLYCTFENGRVEGFLEGSRSLKPHEMTVMPSADEISTMCMPKLIGNAIAEIHSCDFPLDRQPRLWGVLDDWFQRACGCEERFAAKGPFKLAEYKLIDFRAVLLLFSFVVMILWVLCFLCLLLCCCV
jgi:hypothetical protein